MDRFRPLIIIPCYNEKDTLKKVLLKYKPLADVLVVDDCSFDNSYEIAKIYSTHLVKNKKNVGYDKTIKAGVNFAFNNKYTHVITVDADDQFFSKDVKKVIKFLRNGSLFVVANREKLQRFSEKILSFFSCLFWGISDPISGLKGFKLRRDLINQTHNYDAVGTSFLKYFVRNKVRITQFKIKTKPRIDISRFGNNFCSEIKIIKLIFFFKH